MSGLERCRECGRRSDLVEFGHCLNCRLGWSE